MYKRQKLGLKLDKESQAQLLNNSSLILEVSAARLFDEVIKLLLHAESATAFQLFAESGLFALLFPESADQAKQNKQLDRLVHVAMRNTEERLGKGKGVSPFYLYATLLWPAIVPRFQQYLAKNESPPRAMELASSSVFADQSSRVSIPKRFSLAIRDTWYLQTQLDRRQGNRADKLMEHSKFRAGYDFVVMREESGEDLNGLGEWWTKYQSANSESRETMRNQLGIAGTQKRRRRRRRKSKSPD